MWRLWGERTILGVSTQSQYQLGIQRRKLTYSSRRVQNWRKVFGGRNYHLVTLCLHHTYGTHMDIGGDEKMTMGICTWCSVMPWLLTPLWPLSAPFSPSSLSSESFLLSFFMILAREKLTGFSESKTVCMSYLTLSLTGQLWTITVCSEQGERA